MSDMVYETTNVMGTMNKPAPFSCPFCARPLHLHGSVGDSGKPDTSYCELVRLRQIRNWLLDYARDQSLDFDSDARSARLGDLIEEARILRDAQSSLSSCAHTIRATKNGVDYYCNTCGQPILSESSEAAQ